MYHGHVFLIASTLWHCYNVELREVQLASNINFSKQYSWITHMEVEKTHSHRVKLLLSPYCCCLVIFLRRNMCIIVLSC